MSEIPIKIQYSVTQKTRELQSSETQEIQLKSHYENMMRFQMHEYSNVVLFLLFLIFG